VTEILIIEDEDRIADPLATSLRNEGYVCRIMRDGPSGLRSFQEREPDLIILDLMLPGMDGLSVCRKIRETSRVPVLMLTARSGVTDEVLGFELGADDYVKKPFSMPVLKSRLRSLLRRTQEEAEASREEEIVAGDLVIDEARHRVTRKGVPIELTSTEFSLLLLLAKSPGHVFSREQLLEKVWGYRFEAYRRTVDSHVNRLRKKIEEDPSAPQYVLTVYKVGYRFREDT
jgi:DNA-binding response OmpR family regulator